MFVDLPWDLINYETAMQIYFEEILTMAFVHRLILRKIDTNVDVCAIGGKE